MKIDLNEFGLNIGLMFAGFFGSLITAKKGKSWTEQLVSIVAGTMGANYITPIFIDWFNLGEHTMFGAAFVLGFGGLKTVEYTWERLFTR